MWAHKDKPPKGNDYGLLTRKVRAAPKNEKELRLLMSDKNAWVGVPIGVVPQEEARKELPVRCTHTLTHTHTHTHTLTHLNLHIPIHPYIIDTYTCTLSSPSRPRVKAHSSTSHNTSHSTQYHMSLHITHY
jgi:hypothetical protein